MQYKEEIMNEVFTKHLFDFDTERPFHMAVHHFTGLDTGDPHNHPFRFRSFILRGSYVERIWRIVDGKLHTSDVVRQQGTTHVVEADHIHQIIELPDGDCWTVIQPEAKIQEPGFYRFDNDEVAYRQWNGDWQKVT